MKTTGKKFLAIFLTLLLSMAFTTSAGAADTAGCKNVLSDTVYDFSLAGAAIGSYFQVNNGNNETTYPGSITAFATVDGKSCVEITQGSVGIMDVLPYNVSSAPISQGDFAFSVKRVETDEKPFCFGLRSGSNMTDILSFENGKIKAMRGTVELGNYNLGEWYDVKISIDMPQYIMKISYKASTASAWQTHEIAYRQLNLMHSESTVDITSASIVRFGYRGSSTTTPTTYLTNYMQNTGSPLIPTMTNDFESKLDNLEDMATALYYTTNGTNNATTGAQRTWDQQNDTRTGWILQDFGTVSGEDITRHTALTHTDIDGDGDNEAVLASDDSVAAYPTMYKVPFFVDADVWHRIRFKMGNSGDNRALGYFGIKIGTATNYPVLVRQNSISIGSITRNRTNKAEGTMYDFEVTYKANDTKIYVSFWDENGVQYTSSVDCTAGYLSRVDFSNQRSSAVAAKLYIDDFVWEMLPAEAAPEVSLTSGKETAAALDEKLVFEFDETINAADTATNATVSVTSGGEAVEIPATVTANKEKVYVTLSGLTPNTAYEAALSNVKTLSTQNALAASKSFTTTPVGKISSDTPVIDGNSATVNVESPFISGAPVKVIAALYNNDGELVQTIMDDYKVFFEKKSLSLDIAGFKEGGSVKVFVWNGLSEMTPYGAFGNGSFTK